MNWVDYGWVPASGWNLPDEFVHPNEFAFTSDRAQFILEEGGYAGYGRARPTVRAVSRDRRRMSMPTEVISGVNQGAFGGYGQVHPMGWHRFRAAQGRGMRAGGYRGYGATWDRYANRLVVPG